MKSTQKITKVQLKVNHSDESFWLGVVSAEPDYKLSLLLNNKFNLSLKNISPLKVPVDNGSELEFSRFSDHIKSPEIFCTLFSNRSGKNFLLKNLKNIDYIFQAHDLSGKYHIKSLTSSLREIESITAVFTIDLKLMKEKNIKYLIQ
ncbi:MAG: IPExxxVDY family protein [Candidatus Theseobacter exili]|nr:IPExxxVDY family protein [Candidatus Theseobacter exili]